MHVTSNPGTNFYIVGSQTANGTQNRLKGAADGPFDDITITFKTPASLGPGTYNDTLTLKACFDQACTRQVLSSPQTVPITYTVVVAQPQAASISSISPDICCRRIAIFPILNCQRRVLRAAICGALEWQLRLPRPTFPAISSWRM